MQKRTETNATTPSRGRMNGRSSRKSLAGRPSLEGRRATGTAPSSMRSLHGAHRRLMGAAATRSAAMARCAKRRGRRAPKKARPPRYWTARACARLGEAECAATMRERRYWGAKRHLLVDTDGLILKVLIHTASVQDRDGAVLVPDQLDETLGSSNASGPTAATPAQNSKTGCGNVSASERHV